MEKIDILNVLEVSILDNDKGGEVKSDKLFCDKLKIGGVIELKIIEKDASKGDVSVFVVQVDCSRIHFILLDDKKKSVALNKIDGMARLSFKSKLFWTFISLDEDLKNVSQETK